MPDFSADLVGNGIREICWIARRIIGQIRAEGDEPRLGACQSGFEGEFADMSARCGRVTGLLEAMS